ncbi:Do family serine endopeptidase [Saccharicrinis aurantiacus]|uniref:Do family serine endopeptidase n=1 Tax=Saccharicrinis aurantiacus TaxID=1849719 RepID=UPI0008390317|nr:Do family serine endopeptidase [Saccharicrinis aurantiacus]
MNVKKFFFVFLAAVMGGIIGVYTFVSFYKPEKHIVEVQQQVMPAARFAGINMSGPQAGGGLDFTLAAEKSVEAVVHVMTKQNSNSSDSNYGNPFYDFFFGPRGGMPNRGPVMGSGSGVILSEDGYIVTNNHVIDGADEIEVILNDRKSFIAKLVGTDPTTDIAVLKIEQTGLTYLNFGNSDDIKVGEWVLAVGNPFNLTSTVTAGIVSAKSRSINILANRNQPMGIESFIQTDAAVNPGNSGGALVNTSGELIGINTAIASQTGSFTGYSFAVPSVIVQKVVNDIKEFGEVQRAFIGVQIVGVTSDIAKEFGLNEVEGVYVDAVTVNGGADAAGIKKGDVIISVDGAVVNTNSQLIEKVSQHRPGDKIKLIVKRDGKRKHFDVILRNSYGSTEIVKENKGVSDLLGGEFVALTEKEKARLGVNYGMKIASLGEGKLKMSGIEDGFIILKANRIPIKSISDIKRAIATTDEGLFITGIYPSGQVAYYAINLEEE